MVYKLHLLQSRLAIEYKTYYWVVLVDSEHSVRLTRGDFWSFKKAINLLSKGIITSKLLFLFDIFELNKWGWHTRLHIMYKCYTLLRAAANVNCCLTLPLLHEHRKGARTSKCQNVHCDNNLVFQLSFWEQINIEGDDLNMFENNSRIIHKILPNVSRQR